MKFQIWQHFENDSNEMVDQAMSREHIMTKFTYWNRIYNDANTYYIKEIDD
jgi:hypothetical protein